MHILLAGGSGFLGTYLAKTLARHHEITILSRNPGQLDSLPQVRVVHWDGQSIQLPPHHENIDVVINLCGLSIARHWNKKSKHRIYESRIKPSQTLVKWSLKPENKPKTFIQISGIDYYDLANSPCTENSPCGHGFLASLAQDWEKTTTKLQESPTRLIIARTAPVLAATHPPLLPLIMSTRVYLGATIGDGKQYFSWIHHHDFTTIIQNMISDETYHGIYNLCSPNPITNATLMHTLAEIIQKPLWLSIPKWLLKHTLGEMATLITDSRKVYPQKLLDQGESFQYAEIQAALRNIIHPKQQPHA